MPARNKVSKGIPKKMEGNRQTDSFCGADNKRGKKNPFYGLNLFFLLPRESPQEAGEWMAHQYVASQEINWWPVEISRLFFLPIPAFSRSFYYRNEFHFLTEKIKDIIPETIRSTWPLFEMDVKLAWVWIKKVENWLEECETIQVSRSNSSFFFLLQRCNCWLGIY